MGRTFQWCPRPGTHRTHSICSVLRVGVLLDNSYAPLEAIDPRGWADSGNPQTFLGVEGITISAYLLPIHGAHGNSGPKRQGEALLTIEFPVVPAHSGPP